MKNLFVLIISFVNITFMPRAQASFSAQIQKLGLEKNLTYMQEQELSQLSLLIQKHEKEQPSTTDYLYCVKGEAAFFTLMANTGLCVSLKDNQIKRMTMGGMGYGFLIAAGISLVIYDKKPEAKIQTYDPGLAVASAHVIRETVKKMTVQMGRGLLSTKLGIGGDITYTSSEEFGKLFLIGVSLGAGGYLGFTQITIKDITNEVVEIFK